MIEILNEENPDEHLAQIQAQIRVGIRAVMLHPHTPERVLTRLSACMGKIMRCSVIHSNNRVRGNQLPAPRPCTDGSVLQQKNGTQEEERWSARAETPWR